MARIIKDKCMIDKKYLRQFTISFIFNEINDREYCRYTRKDVSGKRISNIIYHEIHKIKEKYPHYSIESEYEIYYEHNKMSLIIYLNYYNTSNDTSNMKKLIWKLT